MTDPVQALALVVSAALLLGVLELVRRRRLDEELSLVWLLGAVGLLLLAARRELLDVLAAALGVHYPPALLLLALILFGFLALLYFSVVVSRQREQIERLVEDVALLDALRRHGEVAAPTAARVDDGE